MNNIKSIFLGKRTLIGFRAVVLILILSLVIFNNTMLKNSANTEKMEYRTEVGKVSVFDSKNNKITEINLSAKEGDMTISFNPHDVIVSKDSNYLWVTATAPQEQFNALGKDTIEHIHLIIASDQIFIIDTKTNTIAKRINAGQQLGLSDLILTSDGKYAYVSAEKGNAIYKIDTNSFYVLDLIQLPPESRPHEIYLSEDGSKLYTRDQKSESMYRISTRSNSVMKIDVKDLPIHIEWTSH